MNARGSALGWGLRLLAGAALALGMTLATAGPALAATAAIEGRVVNRTTDRPLAGATVTLQAVQGDQDAGTTEATTDADGTFRFPGVQAGSGWSYQAVVKNGEATYLSKVLRPDGGETLEVALSVYEPTQSAEGITQTDWVVWIDREGAGAAVQQDVSFDNATDRAYVGSRALAGGGRAVVTLPMLPGAKDLQHVGYFLQCCEVVQGAEATQTSPLVPGVTRGTLRYSVTDLDHLSFRTWLPTGNFSLLVPQGVEITAPELRAGGQTTDSGITYRVYTAAGLDPQDTIDVEVRGFEGAGAPTAGILLIAAGVLLLLIAVVFITVWISRRRESRRAIRRRARAARASRRNGAADEDFDALVEEIAALDLAYERGAMDEDTYRRVRSATKRRLRALRREEQG